MSTEVNVSQDVQDLISEIKIKNGFDKDSEITYDVGSQTGDGFLSRNIAVTVRDGQKFLDLFVKSSLNIPSSSLMPIEIYYANEIHFYDKISPAIAEFLREKNISDGFTNVPKCYAISKKNIIVLEDLKKKGYRMCDKTKPLNDKYINLVFKTFAKFHAVSFALKDQTPELYQELTTLAEALDEASSRDIDESAFEEATKSNIDNFLASLDPIKDKHILKRSENLAENLFEWGNKNSYNPDKTDYDILTQGDCWCNNMMFLFEEGNKDEPIEIVLLDWQIIRVTIPVFDLAYFFYTSASEMAMKHIDDYLDLYHRELSDHLKKLGNDSDVLYPYAVFKQQWKDNAKFGLHTAFMLIRILLSEKDEFLDFETVDISSANGAENFFKKIRNNDEFYRRMKIVLEHMINKNYL